MRHIVFYLSSSFLPFKEERIVFRKKDIKVPNDAYKAFLPLVGEDRLEVKWDLFPGLSSFNLYRYAFLL